MTYYIAAAKTRQSDLMHYGVKGMQWGIRRYQNEDGTLTEEGRARYHRDMKNEANKDAKRYADAKMFYGEGAGNRRKLLKAELNQKMKDPVYKQYFDEAVKHVDFNQSAKAARAERSRIDFAHGTKRAAKFVGKFAVGAASALLTAHTLYENYPAVKQFFDDHGMRKIVGWR